MFLKEILLTFRWFQERYQTRNYNAKGSFEFLRQIKWSKKCFNLARKVNQPDQLVLYNSCIYVLRMYVHTSMYVG